MRWEQGTRNLAELYRADTDAPVVRPYGMARRSKGAPTARPSTERPGLRGNRASTNKVARVIDATSHLGGRASSDAPHATEAQTVHQGRARSRARNYIIGYSVSAPRGANRVGYL